jgi:hypothetical protein
MTTGTGVTVNSVLPGPTRSEAVVDYLKGLASTPTATPEQAEKEFFEKHRPTSFLQRMAENGEVASLVTYLASPLTSNSNGAAVRGRNPARSFLIPKQRSNDDFHIIRDRHDASMASYQVATSNSWNRLSVRFQNQA